MRRFFFWKRERKEGKKRSTCAVHSLRLLTCLQPTPPVQLVSLNGATRSRIRGPAVAVFLVDTVAARFRCIFQHHVRFPGQGSRLACQERG